MIKIFAAFAILTVMISTASVYNLKQATYDLEEKKRDISAHILKDREAIKVLKAEMAYLSRPERLERLSRRHLVLDVTQNDQLVAGVEDLSVNENIQMVSLPVDNFQLLLPRQKPNPMMVAKAEMPRAPQTIRVASVSQDIVSIEMNEVNAIETKSLYDRILAKIGN